MLNMYGRQKYTDVISHNIMEYRKTSSFQNTSEIINVVKDAFPHQSLGNINKISRLLFQVLVI